MAKLKLKKKAKKNLIKLSILIITIIIGIYFVKDYLYKQTYEYKLLELNYSIEEVHIIQDKLNNEELDLLLTKEYDSNISKFLSEKYYIHNNLERYINYAKSNKKIDINKIITLINVNRDKEFYEDIKKSNTEDKELIIVNKYYYLDKEYTPENIIKTSTSYSYANHSLNETAFEAFKTLSDDAKKEGFTIVINSSYRDYEYQEELWETRKSLYGTKRADEFAARAGHSEHQTGYAIDVSDYYDENDTFGETESFNWMKDNCYKYGFILRYPKDKEDITGFNYEPWHYRYVGNEIAEYIYNNEITFDEYHAYYLEKK